MTKRLDLKPNYEDALEFFRVIRPASECCYQTFDDAKLGRDNLARILHGAGHGSELAILNSLGAGTYVSINRMRLGGRGNAYLAEIDTVFADFDKGCPEVFLVEPTLLVQTSIHPATAILKKQAWWRLDRPITSQEYGAILSCMVDGFGADPGAKSPAGVGRLPGFWHQKRQPQLVRIIDGTGERVSAADMIEAYRPPPKPERPHMAFTEFKRTRCGRYLETVAQELQGEVANAPEGSRNATLNWASFRLTQIGASEADVRALLTPAAEAVGLNQGEIKRTIASGIAGAMRKTSA